jgi:hypothetical protein
LEKIATKLHFKLPKGPEFYWTTLVRGPYGEFGVDSQNGYAFHLKPTQEALDSVIPVLNDILSKATHRTVRLVIEFNTADKHVARMIEPWRQRLFDAGYDIL